MRREESCEQRASRHEHRAKRSGRRGSVRREAGRSSEGRGTSFEGSGRREEKRARLKSVSRPLALEHAELAEGREKQRAARDEAGEGEEEWSVVSGQKMVSKK